MNAPLASPRPVRIVGVGSCLGAPIFGHGEEQPPEPDGIGVATATS